MIYKQDLILELLFKRLETVKVGIIVKGVSDIEPEEIVVGLTRKMNSHIYVSAVGYASVKEKENEAYSITSSIEKAVLWRSRPTYAGKIVVFVKNDTDKLHSLAEFEILTVRDLTRYLIETQLNSENNTPTQNFWKALQQTSDYYSFEVVIDFVNAVNAASDISAAIPANMWRLNLLCDNELLGTKNKPEERLKSNRELIFAIGQLSEDSRKKLSRSLAHSKDDDKKRLQIAYTNLQEFYKYGKRETLRQLTMDTVQELFSATKDIKGKKQKKHISENMDNSNISDSDLRDAPIKNKELEELVADAVVSGPDAALQNIKELLIELKKHFDIENEENDTSLPIIGGIFKDRTIVLDNHQSDLRKLVGKVCNSTCWGGLMETEEEVLKDAISADMRDFMEFNPESPESLVSFKGGIDGNQALFHFIAQFDVRFDEEKLDNAERFKPIIEQLSSLRLKLLKNIDMIMYYPVLSFGADDDARKTLIEYIDAWARLYHAIAVNEPIMRRISAGGTSFAARALLLLDILYVKTPKEWKGILLPLHPIYLWRYYEIFKSLPTHRGNISKDDASALTEVLNKLPQILSFIIANSLLSGSSENKVLPCSGNIEMLPTFENKTNRYLGDDGTQAIGEILSRWIGFAPYTRNEVRICSVDAPNLVGNLRAIKDFMDKNNCQRVVYDVYLTRKQNSNTDLSKLDYSGKDYEIGEYIRNGRVSIGVRNVESSEEVKTFLSSKPVHVAFYFDQSSYAIEFGPNNKSLYINPLVITYDYDFDDIQRRGSIYPSSEMESGLIGDYNKLMKSADVISNNMNPRTTYNGNADMTVVESTIQDGQTQWLVVADRDTNNYDPQAAIPIGEMPYDKRMVNVWASSSSRIIDQYLAMLRLYNLHPKAETLIEILKKFGHVASNGLISIPRFGADMQAIDNKKKGLLGTLFVASWYTKKYERALVASLDDSKARLWLYDSRFGNERADLVGLRYNTAENTLYIQPIEVKTRDDSYDAHIEKDEGTGKYNITGHAAGQIAAVVGMLYEIFCNRNNSADMFISARREVLKYQIVSECFRSIHDSNWQKEWYGVLKRAFSDDDSESIKIVVSGLLIHVKLSEASGGTVLQCVNPDFDDCPIEFRQLTAKEIQTEILGNGTILEKTWLPDYDDTDEMAFENRDAIVDHDMDEQFDTDSTLNEKDEVFLPDVSPGQSASYDFLESDTCVANFNIGNIASIEITKGKVAVSTVTKNEIEQLVRDFKRSCGDYHINLRECESQNTVIGPSVIRLCFKLGRGQSKQGLEGHLEDIGREMKRSGIIIQDVRNSDKLFLDVPRLQRDKVLFKEVLSYIPKVTSPEQLFFPLGRTPNGGDVIEDLGQMPHMLVGGSTGSGKSVFLFSMLASLLLSHPRKEDMQLILSSSKMEDFIHFEGLPHLYSGHVISDAVEATQVIKDVVYTESERRGKLLAEARVANIGEYNKKMHEKLAPIIVVIDEFADLVDQLETKKEQNAFYKPVQRIAQAGRSRGIHLVICTQRPEAKLVPSTTKAQLNGRVALRVNDGISSRMIIESSEAQYLQKHGDMIYKNGDIQERVQGYLIEIEELDEIVKNIIDKKL